MSKANTPTVIVAMTVRLPRSTRDNLDRAILDARVQGGEFIPRGDVIAAIIESVDLPRFVAKMAKDAK